MFLVSSVSSGPISLNFNDEILLPNFNEISKTRCSAEKTFTILSNSFEEFNESTATHCAIRGKKHFVMRVEAPICVTRAKSQSDYLNLANENQPLKGRIMGSLSSS